MNHHSDIEMYVQAARQMASEVFGPSQTGWTYSGHWFDSCGPMMAPNFQQKTFAIRLSKRAETDKWVCVHEIGHEALHSLAPTDYKDDTVIEEGAACWLADHFRFKVMGDRVTGARNEYFQPYQLVSRLLAQSPRLIAECRSDGKRFCDISIEDLKSAGARMADNELALLCTRFAAFVDNWFRARVISDLGG